MGKRKRRRSNSTQHAYFGDRVLCLYLIASCCCIPLWSRGPSGQEPEWPVNESLRQLMRDVLDRPEAELVFGTAVIGLIVGWFAVLIGLWRSQSWALWVMLLLNLPGAIYSGFARDWATTLPAASVVAYCTLRLLRVLH